MVEQPIIAYARMKMCETIADKLSSNTLDNEGREALETMFESTLTTLYEQNKHRATKMEYFWMGYQRAQRGFKDEFALLPYGHALHIEHLKATRCGNYCHGSGDERDSER